MQLNEFKELFAEVPQRCSKAHILALYSQAQLETGNFTSNLFLTHNNMFGMRPARTRSRYYTDITTGGNGEFASYSDVLQSLLDRVDHDNHFNRSTVFEHSQVMQYANKVFNQGYTHEDTYVKTWLRLYNEISPLGLPLDDDQFNYEDENEISFLGSLLRSKYFWLSLAILFVGTYFYGKKLIKRYLPSISEFF